MDVCTYYYPMLHRETHANNSRKKGNTIIKKNSTFKLEFFLKNVLIKCKFENFNAATMFFFSSFKIVVIEL